MCDHEEGYYRLMNVCKGGGVFYVCLYTGFGVASIACVSVWAPGLIRGMSFPRSLYSFISRGGTGSQGHMDDPVCILSLHSYITT